MAALDQQEILKIAKGLKQPAAIIRYFRNELHIRAERAPDGSVLVLEEWLRDTAASNEPEMDLS
jgi:hypothetical protein